MTKQELQEILAPLIASIRRQAWAIEQKFALDAIDDEGDTGEECPACGSSVANILAIENGAEVGTCCDACGAMISRDDENELEREDRWARGQSALGAHARNAEAPRCPEGDEPEEVVSETNETTNGAIDFVDVAEKP